MDSTIPRDSIVSFDTTSNCEMYNSYDRVGLSVIRPNHKEIRLNRIPANDITVFYPFIATETQHNEPDSVALEYLYMKDQEIRITR